MTQADMVPRASDGHGPLPRWGWAAVVAAVALVPATAIGPLAGLVPAPLDASHGIAVEPCQAPSRKVAAPGAVLLGDSVGVTLSVDASCLGEDRNLGFVLVLDGSASMAGQWHRDLTAAARDLVTSLDLPGHPKWRVGVVAFNTVARSLCQLTNDEAQVRRCVSGLPSTGGTRIDLGIDEAMKVLYRGRQGPEQKVNIILVATDGANNAGCGPVLQAARSASSQGVLLLTTCLGRDCDTDCMRRAATSPGYYYEAAGSTELNQAFAAIATVVTRTAALHRIAEVEVEDQVPANMAYLPGAGAPPPAWDPGTRLLKWPAARMPTTGITYSYRLRPLEVGDWPTNVRAGGSFTDTLGRTGTFTFTVPQVLVLSPPATPTEVATPAPTPSPTPRPRRLFLPVSKTTH